MAALWPCSRSKEVPVDYTVRRAAPALRSHDLAMAWVAVKQYCMYVQSSNSSFVSALDEGR